MYKKGVEQKELTKEEVLQIPKLIKEGLRYEDISKKFHVHENTIKNWVYKLRKVGYTIKTTKGRKSMLDNINNK